MKQKTIAFCLLFFTAFLSANGSDGLLRTVRTVPLPGVTGRIDHMDIDLENERLFVAALGNNSLEVIDLQKGSRAARVSGLNEPQGVLVIPDRRLLLVTNGGDGSARAYDSESFAPVRTIKFSSDADNIRYSLSSGEVYVGYGKGMGIVDVKNLKRKADIPLAGHPESFQLEMNGKRMFVNIPAAGHVAVLDRTSKSVLARWPVPKSCKNFPMALDEAGKRLFVGCRNPATMIVYDTDTGKRVAELKIAGDADDIFIDSERKRIYVTCGAGFFQVFEFKENDTYPLIANVPTRSGARTSLFVPKLQSLYVAIPGSKNQTAEIRIFSFVP